MNEEIQKSAKVLHLLTSGGIGGIEVLLRDIVPISKENHSFAFLNGEGSIFEQLRNSSQKVYFCNRKRKLSISRLLLFRNKARENDIIVVHNGDPFLQMYFLLLHRFLPKKKFIAMIHHCYSPEIDFKDNGVIKKGIRRFLISEIMRISDRLIFVSKAGYESYTGFFNIEKKAYDIVYNGIGNEMILSGQSVQKKKTEKMVRLVFVGRLVPIKGVDQLLDALSMLRHSFSYFLDIVGDGKARESLEKKVLELGMEACVAFHGFQTDVRPFLDRADIFVYPSRTEIFGISILEAMAHRCICVANSVGGIPEIIQDGVNGFLNKDNSEQGLRNAIEKAINVLNEDKAREEMLNEASKTSSHFTVEKTAAALDLIFEEMIIYDKNSIDNCTASR